MRNQKLIALATALISILILPGCSMFKSAKYVPFNFKEDRQAKPMERIEDKNNPREVIEFAETLSNSGRNREAGDIYMDASKRFKSRSGEFEIDCRMAAVREYWLAGEIDKARGELSALEKDQDIYSYSRESKEIRKLRALLNESGQVQETSETA